MIHESIACTAAVCCVVQLRASTATAGNESMEALRHRQRLEARAAEEEDLMVRVPLSKEQRKQLKADRRHNMSGSAMMNDFADDVADLVGVSPVSTLCLKQKRLHRICMWVSARQCQ